MFSSVAHEPETVYNLLPNTEVTVARSYGGEFDGKWTQNAISGCHVWCGTIQRGKYGHDYGLYSPGGGRRRMLAHRFAYERAHGAIPEGGVIDHLCRNTRCVNPQHMEVVSIGENVRRGVPGNTKVTHCPQGHPYAGENLYVKPTGQRQCRRCRRADSALKKLAERSSTTVRPYDLMRPRALPIPRLSDYTAFDAVPSF